MKMLPGMVAAALLCVFGNVAFAQALSEQDAVALAEKFVAEYGYTNLPPQALKWPLNKEMWDSALTRDQVLRMRFNSLMPKAIGIRHFSRTDLSGWSVAFDYVPRKGIDPANCRIVEMKEDGTTIWMSHQDGVKKFFAGFDGI